ncbi:SCO3242 family prenyltransferase [Streptomyces sp. NPDC058001]|uniref:SCO3242 family prenyltransferase n=1 Tax=Streptomyces sp. NPDC058001 TaxID=3346300 RepID=UPI0036E3BBBE
MSRGGLGAVGVVLLGGAVAVAVAMTAGVAGRARPRRDAPAEDGVTPAPSPRPVDALVQEQEPAAPRPGTGASVSASASGLGRPADWVELLRLPALFTVPGDALAGVATTGRRPGRRTLYAIGASLCLYEAGMALNDWADRAEDAVERPHRPLPSGRIRPAAALAAAGALTAAGLALAARAGRPALAVAGALAATVWAYDLGLKHTPAGPVAMAAARGLDLALGAAATGGRARDVAPSAALLGAHTLAVTAVSRHEADGGSSAVPLAALAATAALAHTAGFRAGGATTRLPAGRRVAAALGLPGSTPAPAPGRPDSTPVPAPGLPGPTPAPDPLRAALALVYFATAARPLWHAVLNPSPPLTQRAVGGGIRAMIPLQAALAARAGSPATALATAALAPAARTFAKRVSIT